MSPTVRAGQVAGPTASSPQTAAPPGGRGGPQGGRPNPLRDGAELYANTCAGCHGGADGSAGRAPALLNDKLLSTLTDQQMMDTVRHGIPGSEMMSFPSAAISDDQLLNVFLYLRTQAGNTKPRVQFVPDPNGMVIESEKQKFKIEVLSRDLETPWGMAFAPDGSLLITERPGRIRVYRNGTLSEPVKGAPMPRVQQDGGYLDISLHPQFAKNGWVYLSYTEVLPGWTPPSAGSVPPPTPGGRPSSGPQVPSNTVIVRGKINKDNQWTEQQVLFRSPSALYSSQGVHYGSRFLWDKQGHLFFTLGERGVMQNAQTLTDKNSLGKIHRINDDGSVPADNPYVATPGVDPTIWSYGHRNPEGLATDPVTGKLWESEHGPSGGDEINLIEPKHNYGWGVISMGMQPGITEHFHEGMEQPVVYYNPTLAPSAISFYTGDRYPGWKNHSLFVCALLGQQLRRLEISGDKVTHQEVLFTQFGRVRDIVQGPDGYLYLLLQNPTGVNGLSLAASTPGMLIRLLPAS